MPPAPSPPAASGRAGPPPHRLTSADVDSVVTDPPLERSAQIERLRSETFDLLVVGGGVTGAGVALDAASRGLRVALVERDDLASGTSSKSSKLVHGGLRYLQQGDVKLVYQALRERKRLRDNAPHLVKILPFLIPIMRRDGIMSRRIARAFGTALWAYDLTGGWRIGKFHRRLKADAALAHMPTIDREALMSAYIYYDATVDDARLVLTLARTAIAHGAVVVNRCSVTAFTHAAGGPHSSGPVTGAVVHVDGHDVTVTASAVVSATGVWADAIARLEAPGATPSTVIRPAKGIHLTVPWHLVRNTVAAVIAVPGDKRNLFVVPWGPQPDGTFSHTYIGTTDTDYDGPLDDPPCTDADIDYVIAALNATVTTNITADDVTAVWAGLRPLVKSTNSGNTKDISRMHKITVGPGGIISIAGGKLTTYREMAEHTVDAVMKRLGRRGTSRTRSLALLGADGFAEQPAGSPAAHLADRFGSLRGSIEALVAADSTLGEPLVAGLPYLRAEAVYAVTHELATTLTDVLTRRTRAHLFDRAATLAAAPAVARLIAPLCGWDDARADAEVAAYAQLVADEERAARR